MELFPDNCLNETSIELELHAGYGLVVYSPEEQALLGYAIARRSHELNDLLRLGVRPSHQGLGLGETLLLAMLREPGSMMLTVRKDNARALRLYRKHGFDIVGHVQDAWVMRR